MPFIIVLWIVCKAVLRSLSIDALNLSKGRTVSSAVRYRRACASGLPPPLAGLSQIAAGSLSAQRGRGDGDVTSRDGEVTPLISADPARAMLTPVFRFNPPPAVSALNAERPATYSGMPR